MTSAVIRDPIDVKVYQTRDSIADIWGERKPYKYEWPTRVDERYVEKPEKWVQSACVLCSNGCGMDIGVKDGKIVGVRGRAADRVNKGRLGPKGMHTWVSNAHKDRLTHPLIRKNGKLEKATWDEAMSLIVKKTKEIQQRLTSHGIAFYTSGQLFLEEYYALSMVGKGGLQTLHMDGNTRLCTATAAASMRESFGCDGQPGSYTDIDHTACLFLVGHNVSATQTVLWARMLDRLDGPDPPKLIVVDPRLSDTAKRATVHLAPRIGTNMAVLNGIQYLLFKMGCVDRDYVAKNVIGLDALQDKVRKYTPRYVEEVTGIQAARLEEAAMIIGRTPSLLSTALQGVYQSNQATAAACQVNNINLLRGLIGKPGSGVFQMNGQPTAQNNRETGCDGEFPGFRNHQNPIHMQEWADIWNLDNAHVPHWALPTHIQKILSFIANGSIEMLWVSGTNPLVSLPNLNRVRELLTKPELLLITQDIFLTETAQISDIVLPAAQWGEKTGCFTNVDRTVHISHKAVDPPGEARSDLQIFIDFSKRMDFKDKHGNPLITFDDAEGAFDHWKKMSKGRPCDYSSMTYEKLTGGSGIQWPCNEANPNGKERLFGDGVFFTDIEYCESYGHDLETGVPLNKDQYKELNPNGRAILKVCDYHPALEGTDEEYPLQLSTGRRALHFHTRTKTGRVRSLQEADPFPQIQMSKEDADAAGIQHGERVIVQSRRGKVELPAIIGDIAKGQTFIPFHFGYFDSPHGSSRAANELTLEQWDPVSKQPMFKSGAVSVTKVHQVGEVMIHAKEQQTPAVNFVYEHKSSVGQAQTDKGIGERYLDIWLNLIRESIALLLELYNDFLPQLIDDLEVHAGICTMQRLTNDLIQRLEPQLKKYDETSGKDFSHQAPRSIQHAIFSSGIKDNAYSGEFRKLLILQAFHVYISSIESQLIALVPAAQAIWDKDLTNAVLAAQTNISRQQAWIKQQLQVNSTQTLIVPGKIALV